MQHFGKVVSWDGYVVRVTLTSNDPITIGFHSA